MMTPKALLALLVLLCLLLGCQTPAPDPARSVPPRSAPPLGEDADTQELRDRTPRNECLLEGRVARGMTQRRDEQHLTLDEALAFLDRVVADITRETATGVSMVGRFRAVIFTVYAHPNWTHEEAERQIVNACLRVYGLPPLR
jgi:hypothetical protein